MYLACGDTRRLSPPGFYVPSFWRAQELRQRFLACREAHVAAQVAELDAGSAYDYLKRLTDVHRLQLFDVVMQYTAIFSDASGGTQVRHTT